MSDPFLASDAVIDWKTPAVMEQAALLRAEAAGPHDVARRCFEWVRDHVAHCSDSKRGPVVLEASAVLAAGVGYCYSKSHLLAALLRANGLRAGLCYQRLTVDGPGTGYCLHGLNAVWLDDAWYRIDARGNKPGVDAQFCPPDERLAFPIEFEGEHDIDGVFATPLPKVAAALSAGPSWDSLLRSLPDIG